MKSDHPMRLLAIMLLLFQATSVSGLCCLEKDNAHQHHQMNKEDAGHHGHAGHDGHAMHDTRELPADVSVDEDCSNLTCALQGCAPSSALLSMTLTTAADGLHIVSSNVRTQLYSAGLPPLFRPPKS